MPTDLHPLPELGKAVLVAETHAGKFQLQVTSGHSKFIVDEEAAAGGMGSGPDPYDLLSAALGACTTMTIRLYADHKAWPPTDVRTKVLHHRASLEENDTFERIVELDGALTAEQRQRLLEIAEHCPVHKTLDRGSNIQTYLGVAAGTSPPPPKPPEHMIAMTETAKVVG